MLLTVDIGNTNINIGIFKNSHLLKRYSLPTRTRNYAPALKKVFRQEKIEEGIICSVVPEATQKLSQLLKPILKNKLHILGKNCGVGLKNLYRNSAQVGQDRLVNAYAGTLLYGAPLVVVDFGTAITFDIISRRKEYLGGMILPGLEMSLLALFEKTALLPKISLSRPKEFIGRDTASSILSGLVYGFAGLTDALSKKIKAKIGKDAKIIGTGGDIDLLARYATCFDKIDRDLTLKGLNLLRQG